MKQFFKKNDLILLMVIAAAGCIITAFVYLSSTSGSLVQISVSGNITKTLPLDTDTQLEIKGENGKTCLLVIENGEAFVKTADCPDMTCVNTGRISKAGQTIICLPNRIVIKIINENSEDGVDAVL